MTIYLKDLIQHPHMLDILRGQREGEPLTIDDIEADIPIERRHPMNPSRDEYFATLSEEIERHPIRTAGIRRS